MKKAREKWLIKGRRENEEQEHHHKRKEAHKIIRNMKKLHIKNVTESIEVDQKYNNLFFLFSVALRPNAGHGLLT